MPNTKKTGSVMINTHTKPKKDSQYQEVDKIKREAEMPNTTDSVMINIDTKLEDDSQYQPVNNMANAQQPSCVRTYKRAREAIAKTIVRTYLTAELGLLGSEGKQLADTATEVTANFVDKVVGKVVEKASEAGCSIM